MPSAQFPWQDRDGEAMNISDMFHKFAARSALAVGSTWSFLLAIAVVLTWAVTGPLFSYSDTWQLIINTGTTIVTFLMVFLIQNAQNRSDQAVQIKLDELIRAIQGARNKLLDLEEMSDEDLRRLQEEFKRLCADKSPPEEGEDDNSADAPRE